MKSPLLSLAAALVRAWTRVYTWRMRPALRDARRAEIESDLWEFQEDRAAHGFSPALHLLARLLLGVPADLSWRLEHRAVGNRLLRGTVALAAVTLFVLALWALDLMRARRFPAPPIPPTWGTSITDPLPPPPIPSPPP